VEAPGRAGFDVSAKANGEAVWLLYLGAEGERTTVYHSVGQDLVAETTIISPQLTAPLHYKLVYTPAK
jgi:hypothetical protein